MTTTSSTIPSDQPPSGKPKSALRFVKWILLAIVALVVIAVIIVYVNLNGIVRSTVEKQATASLNVPTTLKGATVSIFGGEVALNNFDVGSPQGFKAPALMSLGGLDVKVKLSELREDPLRVSRINITDPKMVIEMQGMDFNIKKFMDNLPAGEEKPTDGKEPMKLIINDLKVEGAQVVFRPDVAAVSALPGIGDALKGMKQEYVLSIPTLELSGIGTAEGNQNGAAIKEVVSLLVTSLASKAAQSDQLPPELRNVLSLNVDDITKMLKEKVGAEINKQIGKVTEDLSKKVGGDVGKALEGVLKGSPDGKTDPAKAIEQGLGGLLNKKSKDKAAPATQPK